MQRVDAFPGKLFGVLVVASLVLVGLDRLGWLNWAKKLTEVVVMPVRGGFTHVATGVGGAIAPLRYSFQGARRVADLERQLAEVSVDAAKAVALEKENSSLRELVKAVPDPELGYQPLRVVGRGDQWLLAGGGQVGVKAGQVVVSPQKTLVGVVAQADAFIARVRLVADPGSVLAAMTEGGAVGKLTGSTTGQVVLGDVVQKDPLEVGMRILTRGSEGVPAGIVVGVVGEVRQIPSEVYKSAIVKPLFSPTEEYVFVLHQ